MLSESFRSVNPEPGFATMQRKQVMVRKNAEICEVIERGIAILRRRREKVIFMMIRAYEAT